MLRARHLDLDVLTPERAWAEYVLLRQHLARAIHNHRRRLSIVRTDGHTLIDERQWCQERIARLDRLRSGRARVA